ncbi:GMC oxidoreductase [Magnetococcales bacterium HHB-1]
MMIDATSVENKTVLSQDLCIIGSGAAGITLALELGKDGSLKDRKICLLESGDFQFEEKTQNLYKGEVNAQSAPHAPIDKYRNRYFGGSTNTWGGSCIPFDAIDFEKRDYIAHSGWPFSRETLLPFYHRAADYFGIGTFNQHRAEKILQQEQNRSLIQGIEQTGALVTKYHKMSSKKNRKFGKIHRDRLMKMDQLTIIKKANATHLQLDEYGQTIQRVTVRNLDNSNQFFIEAKIFIIATGGLETPRLLLLSNDIQKQGIGNDNDLVGRFYSSHFNSRHGLIMLAKHVTHERRNRKNHEGVKVRRFLSLSDQIMREQKLLNIKISLEKTREEQPGFVHEMANLLNNLSLNQQNHATTLNLSDMKGQLVKAYGILKNNAHIYQINCATGQVPDPKSRVYLNDQRDALNQRRLTLNLKVSKQDVDSLIRSYHIIGQTLGQLGLGRLWFDPGKDGENIIHSSSGKSHHIGTTRIGSSKQSGVVNPNCRVHTTNNLYIASSAVFPTPSHANPTYTIVAMSIRLADHLKKKLQTI